VTFIAAADATTRAIVGAMRAWLERAHPWIERAALAAAAA